MTAESDDLATLLAILDVDLDRAPVFGRSDSLVEQAIEARRVAEIVDLELAFRLTEVPP